jgi:UDP-glucose 4-epimerase
MLLWEHVKYMDEKARVLVTGGAGFIGSHVVDKLVGSSYDVRVVDNLSEGRLSNIEGHLKNGRVRFFEGDVRDAELVGECVRGVDAVVHLAAVTSVPFSVENPSVTFDNNVNGTLNLLDACTRARVKRFVFVSSCSVYGEPSYLPVDEKHPTFPLSPYAASKLEGEESCKNHQERHGLPTVVLRLFNVYGPRQRLNAYSGVITQFLDRVRKHMPLVIFGDGSQTRDFVHVWDVAEAALRALETERAEGEVFNVGSGRATSVNSLAKSVIDLTGANVDVVYEKPRVGDIKASFADISKAKKQLGYKPIVPLEKGLGGLVEQDC